MTKFINYLPKQYMHTPWKVWQLSKDSDPEERWIITTEDGEDEITGIVYRQADAEYIVKAANNYEAIENLPDIYGGIIEQIYTKLYGDLDLDVLSYVEMGDLIMERIVALKKNPSYKMF